MVQLLNEDELKSELGEAFASFMINPTITWAKFILTDDRKNGNGKRVPKEEFANLIHTGINMPVKMAPGVTNLKHRNAQPLGTITNLKEVVGEDGNPTIVALAALWNRERPEEVAFIKNKVGEGERVDVSWEILYEEEAFNNEHNSTDLFGTVLRAATIVTNPAYEGRTPFLAIASMKKDEIITDTQEQILEDELKTIEELQADLDKKVAELDETNASLASLKVTVSEKETALAEKEEEVKSLTTKTNELETELVGLRELKASLDAENEKKAKLEEVKNKFSEAQIEKDEEFFTENAKKLIALSPEALDFMIQELKVFAEGSKETSAEKKTKIPALLGTDGEEVTVSDLAKHLRESKAKK